MKVKSWLKYLVYLIVLFLLIALWEYVGMVSKNVFNHSFHFNYSYIVISQFIGVCIGAFLGIEHFISEIRKAGTWKIKLPKLILIGIPSLYFAITYIMVYSSSKFLCMLVHPLFFLLANGSGYVIIFQIIFGYTVITSFYKYNNASLS